MMPVFRHLAVVVLVGYLLLVVVFYVLSGEQLHLRASRGNVNMLPSTSSTYGETLGLIGHSGAGKLTMALRLYVIFQ